MHDQRLQHAANRAEGQVAGHQVVPGNLQQRLSDAFEVAGQRAIENLLARQLRFFDERRRTFGAPLPQIAEDVFAIGVVLQQRELIHELVTGAAIHCPVGAQGFAGTENLLDVDRQVPTRREQVEAPPQLAAITARVGEAVDVVDAQTVDQSFGDQLENLAVSRFEHRRAFDTQAAEFVDVEKAPPVDVIRCGAPTGQTVALAFEQLMKLVETFGSGGIVMRETFLDRGEDLRIACQLLQFSFERHRQRVRVVLVAQRTETISQ